MHNKLRWKNTEKYGKWTSIFISDAIRKMIWGSNFLHPDVKRITNYGRKLYVVILKLFSCDVTQSHTHRRRRRNKRRKFSWRDKSYKDLEARLSVLVSWSTENLLARNKKVLLMYKSLPASILYFVVFLGQRNSKFFQGHVKCERIF